MKLPLLLALCLLLGLASLSRGGTLDDKLVKLEKQRDSTFVALRQQRDTAYRAGIHADSLKAEKDFLRGKGKALLIYPVLDAGLTSGVLPVADPTEIPDPSIEYKLLFDFGDVNPDSAVKEINSGLVEVARVINLHVASGIPVKKLKPVVVVHGGAVRILANNDYYNRYYQIDNPNIGLLHSLDSLGVRVIGCGQALGSVGIQQASLLPHVKVAVTAQVALSSYASRGYVRFAE